MRQKLSLGALAFISVIAGACSGGEPGHWVQETGYRWRELNPQGGDPGFTTMSSRTGIDFTNTVSESLLVGNRILGQGAGVSLGDVDGDGLVDVFLARTEGCNALYRNLGGWRFEDVTEHAGVGACDRFSSGTAMADVDSDRDLDLIVLATTGPNAIFVNDGTGRFTEHRDLGLDTTGRGGTTITMADVDGDSRLDLYVANYKAWNIDDSIPPQRRSFSQMVRQVGPNRFEIVPEHREHYKIVMRPDMGGMRMTTRAEPDQFYQNVGGRFVAVPLASSRFTESDGSPVKDVAESFTLGARFADLNGDHAPDLYVANDFEDTDELWYNDGRGNFRRASWRAQRQMSNSSMGVDIGDLNGDGRLDVFTTDMLANDPVRLKTQIPTHTALPKLPGDVDLQLQQQRNALFENRGDGTFAEVAIYAGVQASGWSWGTVLTDVDLDGWQDILIANGHLWDIMDADTHERLQNRLTDVNWRRLRWEFPPLRLRNVAFRNRGDMTFEDASADWHFGDEEDISHALAVGDLDSDGDMDVVINRLGSPARILRNDASAPRVAVRLVGDAPNTHAVGARVQVIGGAVQSQVHEVSVGGLYMSHSDYEASFAMGTSDSATIVVEWRDGRRSIIRNVRPNREYEITPAVPGDGAVEAPVQLAGESADAAAAPIFTDASNMLRGHVHEEPLFDDWERQLLLPNSLSQLGPGVSWFDYDRDGDEDLLIGSGRGGRLGVFRNDRGRLEPQTGPQAAADLTTVLGMADGQGSRVLLGVSSWESGESATASVMAASAGRQGVQGTRVAVPGSSFATGPLALGDYDGDGDLDLFVGGRAIPGQYPRAASSMLYRNENGRFVEDSAHATALSGVGLVSAASFADVDGDGDADLLLAREWDSILLLLNDGGTLRGAPDSWGLGHWTSRWNGLATGDLNGDGRLDIVATSWGRNTMTPADSSNPLVMFHGPFGSHGEEELLLAQRNATAGGLAPLNSYPRVRISLGDLSSRVKSFEAYGKATVEEVLGPAIMKVKRQQIVTLDHMVFLNNGSGFDGHSLPMEAQVAPASYAGIADFDGDGREDVFLSQNFFPTAVGLPRYDEGRGLLLLGDGSGKMQPVDAAGSGILMYGDQRGAAYSDFDADGRLDIVVAQNASQTRLFRNRLAKPGLRVRLEGSASNPDAIGAQVRVMFGEKGGPVREIQSGSGYWSQNGAVQVFGLPATPTAVWVRWPGGTEATVPVPAGATEVVVTRR